MARSHFYLALAAGVTAVILVALVGFFALREMHAMASDLAVANTRLTALEQMNRKLDRLADMDTKLDRLSEMKTLLANVDVELSQTNHALLRTNAGLATTNGNLRSMRAQITKLAAIRSDIHEMSHKIAGSFLFRAVH